MEYDLAIVIGRFQPFHVGHLKIIERASLISKQILVLVGSANRHRSVKNPFTYEERKKMIAHSCSNKVMIRPLNDYQYNDDGWMTEVRRTVNECLKDVSKKKVAIVGYSKNVSSNYLRMFPEWDFIEIEEQHGVFNATDIREDYFKSSPRVSTYLPRYVYDFLHDVFVYSQEFKWLLSEYQYVMDYKKLWSNTPFPPIFVTVDCVVIQSGHILLINRKDPPYKGSLALPGGFISQTETMVESAIRELKEETQISDWQGKIPPGVLKSYIVKSKVYDDPNRSDRGRTITNAFLFQLPPKPELFRVAGDDDAEKAGWYSLEEISHRDLMEDHGFIIEDILGIELDC